MLLKDLLHIPSLRNARIAAGEAGLHRKIGSVSRMDLPDNIGNWKPNELLLTTALATKESEPPEKLVERMSEAGCTGLAIKTARFPEEIPESIILEANRRHFPILELSLEYSLEEVLNGVLCSILENRTNELNYALDMHHSFFNLMLNGQGLSEIVDKLAELIDSPIVVLGSRQELLGLSSAKRPNIPLLNEFIANWDTLGDQITGGIFPFGSGETGSYAMMRPIPNDQRQGYLIAFVKEKETNNLHSLALEQAANIMGIELLKSQAAKDRAKRLKIDFITELVQGEIASEQEIAHRGEPYGLYPSDSMICVICGRDSDEPDPAPDRDQGMAERKARELDSLYRGLKMEYAKLSPDTALFALKDKIIALIPSQGLLGPGPEGKHQLSRLLLGIDARLTKAPKDALSFGISAAIAKLADIPAAYKQALDAYRLGRSRNKPRSVQFYQAKELTDLLKLIPSDDLKEFVEDTFEAWSGIHESEQREWRKTLKTFYDTHCHIGETAKQLYIHRNTVLYRLNRIEQLTGAHVRNSSDSLRIRMALMIKELIN